jgi:hypothetical protein
MLLQRRRASRHQHDPGRANPYYGFGYRPDWPSILSIAHDTVLGNRLYVMTDRPCTLAGAQNVLPLTIGDGSLVIVTGATVLNVKFLLTLSGAVPQGSAWSWGSGGAGPCNLFDPVSGHAPNPGAGDCADVPGPYTPPPPPATVIAAIPDGAVAHLTFDQPIILTGAAPDDAITFDGQAASAVFSESATTLQFALPNYVTPGSVWAIARQPDWIVPAIANPAGGVF